MGRPSRFVTTGDNAPTARQNSRVKRWLLPIFLDACGVKASKAVPVDCVFPGEEFVDREHVMIAGFLFVANS